MTNRPLVIPSGVRLVALHPDEESQPIDRAVLVCEGPCRPSWTPHRRSGMIVVDLSRASSTAANMAAASAANTASSPRYACEHCNTSRRWGS